MSTNSKTRFSLKGVLVGFLVAGLAGLAGWALFGREAPAPKAPSAKHDTAKKDGAKRKLAMKKARGMRRNQGMMMQRQDRAPVPEGRFEGEVVAVIDGDTIDVMHDGASVRVRLAGIDCPERRQAFGQAAKQRTSELVFGKTVAVDVSQADRFGRALGNVTQPDGAILNETLVREGLAWWYRLYSDDRRLESLEADARSEKVGLWADETQTAPWDFRKTNHRRRGGRGRQGPRQQGAAGPAGTAGAAEDFQ
jgi:micrococcal nuclease